MMNIEKRVNLKQSVDIVVNGNLRLNELSSNNDFQNKLDEELDFRNLSIIPTNSEPTFSPSLDENNLVKNIDEITYQVQPNNSVDKLSKSAKALKEYGIFMTDVTSVKEQIDKIINDSVGAKLVNLTNKVEKLESLLLQTESPIIIRELVKQLRIYEINKKFKDLNLTKDNPKYILNGIFDYKAFNSDYQLFNEKMFETYKNPETNEKYLNKLFTYKIIDLNNALHPNINNCTNDQIKAAIEEIVADKIEDNPNHRLVCFYYKWLEITKRKDQ